MNKKVLYDIEPLYTVLDYHVVCFLIEHGWISTDGFDHDKLRSTYKLSVHDVIVAWIAQTLYRFCYYPIDFTNVKPIPSEIMNGLKNRLLSLEPLVYSISSTGRDRQEYHKAIVSISRYELLIDLHG